MKQRKLYYKTDFKIWERCECGFGAPFYFIYFTDNPRCGVVASYDGREYHGCRLMEDGRLCVAFDDHGLGLGVLRVERRFYLSDADYASGVCDEVFPPTPVTCEDGDEQYNLCLSLEGTMSELNASSVVPPYFIKGEDAKINGVNSIEIVGDAVTQEGDRLTIDAYSKSTVDDLLGDKATKQELQNTAQGLEQSISSVSALAGSNNAKITQLEGKAMELDGKVNYLSNTLPGLFTDINTAKETAENAKNAANEAKETAEATATNLNSKQDTLVSGENIKTINGQSLLGGGNIEIKGSSSGGLSDSDRETINNLIELYEYTRLQAESNDFDTLPLLCGQPMILFGKGTPSQNVVPDNWKQYDIETGEGYNWNGLPSALGQQYINTSVTSGGRYIAVYSGYCTLRWVNF